MLFKYIVMILAGYTSISVEGFFIERFLNLCRQNKVYLQNLKKDNDGYFLKVKILNEDLDICTKIAETTKCKLHIEKTYGVPKIIEKYKKRKIYVIACFAIILLISLLSNFIWQIDIEDVDGLTSEEVYDILAEYKIHIGTYKRNIDTLKIINDIRLNHPDISWIGLGIDGTSLKVNLTKAIDKPDVISKDEICNIVAKEDSKIKKITVLSGTPRVKEGDEVKKDQILVEGVMESEIYGTRFVHSEAKILGEKTYSMEETQTYEQVVREKTGKKEKKIEICLNKFQINFNKGVSKFKIYDKITTNKYIDIFSKFSFPIKVKIISYEEVNELPISYSQEDLKNKILTSLETKLENRYKLSEHADKSRLDQILLDDKTKMTVKLIYTVYDDIGSKKLIEEY